MEIMESAEQNIITVQQEEIAFFEEFWCCRPGLS